MYVFRVVVLILSMSSGHMTKMKYEKPGFSSSALCRAMLPRMAAASQRRLDTHPELKDMRVIDATCIKDLES